MPSGRCCFNCSKKTSPAWYKWQLPNNIGGKQWTGNSRGPSSGEHVCQLCYKRFAKVCFCAVNSTPRQPISLPCTLLNAYYQFLLILFAWELSSIFLFYLHWYRWYIFVHFIISFTSYILSVFSILSLSPFIYFSLSLLLFELHNIFLSSTTNLFTS